MASNCFSRLIGLISLIEIIGAMTQCQGICVLLRHFNAVKMNKENVAPHGVAEV